VNGCLFALLDDGDGDDDIKQCKMKQFYNIGTFNSSLFCHENSPRIIWLFSRSKIFLNEVFGRINVFFFDLFFSLFWSFQSKTFDIVFAFLRFCAFSFFFFLFSSVLSRVVHDFINDLKRNKTHL
jgi:hypothetical protein